MDTRIKISFRNKLLLRAIEDEYDSVAQFSRVSNINYQSILRLISFSASPVTTMRTYGNIKLVEAPIDKYYWTPMATNLAKALHRSEMCLFPQHTWDIKTSTFEMEMDSGNMISYDENMILDRPYQYEQSATRSGLRTENVETALSTLKPRHEMVLRRIYGIGCGKISIVGLSKNENTKAMRVIMKAHFCRGQKRTDRIEHMFKFMEWEHVTDGQIIYLESFEKQFKRNGDLSNRQCEILESIFEQAAERA